MTERSSGVYTNEYVSLGARLQNAASSIALLPVISNQGSSEPQFFTNASDFLFHYGAPDPSLSATVQSGLNYFTEGSGLWGIRVVGDNAKYSGVVLAADNAGSVTLSPVGITDPKDVATLIGGKQTVAAFYPARGVGLHGNTIQLSIDAQSGSTAPISSVTAVDSTVATGALVGGVDYEYYVAPIMADGERKATKVVYSAAAGFSGAILLTWPVVPDAIGYYVYGREADQEGRIALVGIGDGSGTVSYTDVGITVPSTGNKPILALSPQFQDRPFTVSVFDTNVSTTTPVETFQCTLRPFTSNGAQLEISQQINTLSKYIRVTSNVSHLASLPLITSVAKTAMTGGTSGSVPTTDAIIKALQPFANRQYNIGLIINGGIGDIAVQRAMDNLAQRRGDSVALLDVPTDYQEWNKAVDYKNLMLNLCSDYSALFAPDQLQLSNSQQVYAPMSGWAAALCARTDRVASSGHSIAGLNRGRLPVLGSRYSYDDDQSNALFKAHVNYTKTLPNIGTVLWEQQLLGNKVRWLSVRRIVNNIKTSVYGYLLYALQEMNTDSVRRELTGEVNNYLERAVQAEAISKGVMICDSRNNSQATALAGILVATVRITPSIPTHEIILNIEVSQGGVAFTENVVPTSSNSTWDYSSGTDLPNGTSNTTTQFSSDGYLPNGQSHTTTQFSSDGTLPNGTSNTTIEYSSGTFLPSGVSNTTTEWSSNRPF